MNYDSTGTFKRPRVQSPPDTSRNHPQRSPNLRALGLYAPSSRSRLVLPELQDVVPRHVTVKNRLAIRRGAQPPQHVPELPPLTAAVQDQRLEKFSTSGAFPGSDRSVHQGIEALVKRQGESEAHLPVPTQPQKLGCVDRVSLLCHVPPPSYRKHMSKRGMSDLLTTMMAAGGVTRLDARDHRLAHDALRRLGETADGVSALNTFGVSRSWQPDAEVGSRVPGVTASLWDAVRDGRLQVHESDAGADFVLADNETASARRRLSRLPAGQATAIYLTGTDWASRSTARKNSARAATSSSSTRQVSRA